MTGEPTSSDKTSDNQAGADRTEEVWIFAGRRVFKGKRFYAWQDPHRRERYFAKLPAITIGGRYTVTVAREGDTVSAYGDARYTGECVDDRTRREMEALDIAATAILAAQARERNDARRKALDDAVQPLADIAAKLKFGHERDAFLVVATPGATGGHLDRRSAGHS
jgi:hypothetical protein